ncbi:MAG: DUF3127 domain-containing protein [Prevotellaceae bacterium]|jgi:hypothetical protein|nr:DUF3127 domain-containing protein [Prevotellaceae bacterium]
MALELIGKLVKTLPLQSGTSARGAWSKQDFIIETQEQYPRKVCVAAWGERVNELSALAVGDVLKVSFNVESREFNERWYTDVKAWRIDKQGAAQNTALPATEYAPLPSEDDPFSAPPVDDLPF